MIRTEFHVVVNQVESCFGANEGVPPEVRTDAPAKVSHKVVAAGVIGVARERVKVEDSIESQVLTADATKQLRRNMFVNLRHPDGIERVKDWTSGLLPSIQHLTCSPSHVTFNPHPMKDQEVATEGGISAASHGGEQKSPRGRFSARRERTDAKSDINLLSDGGLEEAQHKESGNQSQLFQVFLRGF